jgi:hypothetical protein
MRISMLPRSIVPRIGARPRACAAQRYELEDEGTEDRHQDDVPSEHDRARLKPVSGTFAS